MIKLIPAVVSLTVGLLAPAFAAARDIEACITAKIEDPEQLGGGDAPVDPELRLVADMLKELAKQQWLSEAKSRTLTEALKRMGVKDAEKTVGLIQLAISAKENFDRFEKAESDIEKYEALQSSAAAVLGYFIPKAGLLAQGLIMGEKFFGNWSILDDQEFLERIRLARMEVQNQYIQIKVAESKASQRAYLRLSCENEAVSRRMQMIGPAYAALGCHLPLEKKRGRLQSDGWEACVRMGQQLIQDEQLSHYIQGRILGDPLTLQLAEGLADAEKKRQLLEEIKAHPARTAELAKAAAQFRSLVTEFRMLAVAPDVREHQRRKAEMETRIQCRKEIRSAARAVTEAFNERGDDPEFFELAVLDYQKLVGGKCPPHGDEPYVKLVLKLLESAPKP